MDWLKPISSRDLRPAQIWPALPGPKAGGNTVHSNHIEFWLAYESLESEPKVIVIRVPQVLNNFINRTLLWLLTQPVIKVRG